MGSGPDVRQFKTKSSDRRARITSPTAATAAAGAAAPALTTTDVGPTTPASATIDVGPMITEMAIPAFVAELLGPDQLDHVNV